ncbi:acyl-CoA carboxylase epsilon subunit [Streptomyces heilongjiangensis]|uniref:Acyl-CoA carboxylase epsilon subunit n=1 Tax=Streptomyces heilongjiangensis TaxID=945052 RepID=A0ABW1BIA0_9ACTN|nr:acyl-CoA carboxylase epsilon subunit [Streptomyces heilongjiangensis]MDC2951810.1 acyl-CoA carboxylase epsilon subunit [Streptomyces heilongjiangensis]
MPDHLSAPLPEQLTAVPAAVRTDPVIRVVRGAASEEELAALTAVLLARAAGHDRAPGHHDGPGRPFTAARWSRLERRPYYRSPLSWRLEP